jgi:hypothetical protein
VIRSAESCTALSLSFENAAVWSQTIAVLGELEE